MFKKILVLFFLFATVFCEAGFKNTFNSDGVVPPRKTTTQRDALTAPSRGQIIYNTSTDLLNVYNGSWSSAVDASSAQTIGGAKTFSSVITSSSSGKYFTASGGALTTTGDSFFTLSGTNPDMVGVFQGLKFSFTGLGANATELSALKGVLSGNIQTPTAGVQGENTSINTGLTDWTGNIKAGVKGLRSGGDGPGVWGMADGNDKGIGVIGVTDTEADASLSWQVGVAGIVHRASFANAGKFRIGVWGKLTGGSDSVPIASGAGVFDNGATTHDILGLYDNGSSVGGVADGGIWTIGASGGTATHPINGDVTISGLTASKPVFTDGSKKLVSGNMTPSLLSAVYFNGYFANGPMWSTSSTSFVDGTNSGGNTLTTRVSSGMSVSAGASNVCGITWTPSVSTAVYLVSVTLGLYNNTAADNVYVRLTDGSVVVRTGSTQAQTNGEVNSITLQGIYVPATGSAVTLKVQFAANASVANSADWGDANIENVSWTVEQIGG